MTTMDNDLKTILKIRKMRVDALVRVQRQHEQAKTQAADAIDTRQQELKDKEVEVRELEAQQLQNLTNGQYVKIDQVQAFSKQQLKGVKQIVDANREIEIAHKYFEEAKEVLKDSVRATQAAQKKLISIEEAVRELSGK